MSRDVVQNSIPPSVAEQMSPEVRAFVEALLARVDQLTDEVARLRSENDELRAENQRLKTELAGRKSPQNSSLPPSTQHPHAKPLPQRPKSKRPRGGQPGHPKHERALIPTSDCTQVVPLKPTACRRCGAKLHGSDREPLRHQVWELPEIKPLVTEYQRHRLTCACCGESTCAELPPGVPTIQAGPRLVAFTALLMAYFRQSKRRTAAFLEALLQQPCSSGWVVKLQQQATGALRSSYQQLVAALPHQPCVGGDETPTKEGPSKAWLWTFVAATFTVFTIRGSRAATAITDLLGDDFAGIVTCDRAKMYWLVKQLQWCWAHLRRDFQALIDHDDRQVKRLGHDLMRPTRKLFELWARYRDGTLTFRELQTQMQPIRAAIEGFLLRGIFSRNARLTGMCSELYDHRAWLWTFLDHDGVEITNNVSERALRHAVIWRKLSFGTQSAAGSRFVETMLSIIETCRQQRRNLFSFVTAAVQAHHDGRSAPPLLTRP